VCTYSFFFFFSSRRRHTRSDRDWSSDVCSSDLLFLKKSREGPDGRVMAGDTSSLSPTLAASGEKAALGRVSRTAVWVTQLVATPVAEVDQPEGKAGTVTPSKF